MFSTIFSVHSFGLLCMVLASWMIRVFSVSPSLANPIVFNKIYIYIYLFISSHFNTIVVLISFSIILSSSAWLIDWWKNFHLEICHLPLIIRVTIIPRMVSAGHGAKKGRTTESLFKSLFKLCKLCLLYFSCEQSRQLWKSYIPPHNIHSRLEYTSV